VVERTPLGLERNLLPMSPPSNRRYGRDLVRVWSYVPPDLVDQIDAAATAEGLTRSAWMRRLFNLAVREDSRRSSAEVT
jgi:hypothetical protein